MTELLKFILLGIIQGIAEPLPISSSGHLVLAKALFDVETPGLTFELMVHFGSLIAVCIFYYPIIKDLVVHGLGFIFKRNKKNQEFFLYGLKIVIGTIPAMLIGLTLKNQIEIIFTNPISVGVCLIFTSFILYIASKKHGTKKQEALSFVDAIQIGIMQSVALLPGVSRSGSTTCAGLILGYEKSVAMRYSFMLFLPTAIGAIILDLPSLTAAEIQSIISINYLAALFFSTIATYVSLCLMRNILKQNKLHYFSIYCLIMGFLAMFIIR